MTTPETTWFPSATVRCIVDGDGMRYEQLFHGVSAGSPIVAEWRPVAVAVTQHAATASLERPVFTVHEWRP
jgi:hypothetical protein